MRHTRESLVYLLSDPGKPDKPHYPGAFDAPIPAAMFNAARPKPPAPSMPRLDPESIAAALENA